MILFFIILIGLTFFCGIGAWLSRSSVLYVCLAVNSFNAGFVLFHLVNGW